MADELMREFRALNATQRLDALEKLVRILSRTERDFVCDAIDRKNDPISVLPLELVLQIFSHISLFNTWTLQSVCERWRKTLSSEDFIRSSIARWHTQDRSDSGHEWAGNDPISGRVQHMQAVKLRVPLYEKIINDTGTGLQGPQPKLSQRRLDFKGRRIAYISSHQGQGDAVVVHDLINGEERKLRGEARERILLVVLTTTLVAFVTFEGCLYVWQFRSPPNEMSRIQLPSSQVRAAGGDGLTVALAMGGRHGGLYVGSVLLYNAENGLKRFVVEEQCWILQKNLRNLNSCGVLVDSEKKTVDIFSLMYEIIPEPIRRKHLRIDRFRLSFDGQWLGFDVSRAPIDFETSVRDYQFLMAAPHPTGDNKEYRITVCEVPFMGGLPFRLKFSTTFDCNRGKFIRDENDGSKSTIGNDDHREMDVLWKSQPHRPSIPENWLEYVFYMNDTFMVSLEVSKLLTQHSRIRVLCFDPDVQMAESRDTGSLKYLNENFKPGRTTVM